MGDRRFDAPYDALVEATDRAATIRDMNDDEVVYALASASRRMDAYLANVLAVEVIARQRRQRARLWGAVVGLGIAVLLRTVLIAYAAARPGSLVDTWLWMTTLLALAPAGGVGYVAYRLLMRVRSEH